MADKLSRRKLAQFVADRSDTKQSLQESLQAVAAYLIDNRRIRESALVVRAIEDELATRGRVITTVTTATPLDAQLRAQVNTLVNAKDVMIREIVDSAVIGGVRIETPGKTLDATLQTKLLGLTRAKL
ncbi:F0F1 ATP synthase subunit delta [Microbacteriaceae bacterium]|nr:F0F1 ATP synthase subunit delta [Candidatus Saccharibacteria bacterium]